MTLNPSLVVDFSQSATVALQPVPVGAVQLTGSFWGPRLQRNIETTLPTQFALLESTGRLDNFRRVSGEVDPKVVPYIGLFFNDSDLYKWLEAAAWAQVNGPVPALQAMVDEGIRLIEAAQGADGYLHTYHSCERAGERWSNLRDLHEMYCAGHLMQAAVAHHRVTGDSRLLNVACRFADLLCDTFGPEEEGKRVMIDGHEEVEMGLIELARETGNKRYLAQAKFFIEARGKGLLHGGRFGLEYFQDEKPIRAMTCLCGHAVRALYMASGVTDLAMEEGDAAMLAHLEALWTQLTQRRMYITGGMGSRYDGESLGKDFELPNARAYTETCAAIASMMWSHRLLAATGNARYADLIEWTLYNGMLPGWALDGTHYFYVNPLEDDGTHHRQAWYECACCPPNVARTLAELPGYVYSTSPGAIWVHLFMEGSAQVPLGDGLVSLSQRTQYPWDGAVAIEVGTSARFTLQVRIPGWCTQGARLTVNGLAVDQVDQQPVEAGSYVAIERRWEAGDLVQLSLPMEVTPWQSHPLLHENAGRVALSRGPLLYCVEGLDLPPGLSLDELAIDTQAGFEAVLEAQTLGGVVVLHGRAQAKPPAAEWATTLYRPAGASPVVAPAARHPVKAVPYFCWQNRGASPMAIWLPQSGH